MRAIRLLTAVKMDDPPICGDKGAILHLDNVSAYFAVQQRLGEFYGPEPEPGPTRAELEAREAVIQEAQQHALPKFPEPEADGDSPVKRALDDAEEPEKAPAPRRPYGNAPKGAWIRYALAVDAELTQERAELLTKADLMSRYGERL